jgi:hypothetical protein
MASSICAPMRITGFSEVIGSWNTMAISPPRTSRHSRSLNDVNFFADASAISDASPLTRAPGGSNPISASDNIVLPLPDSPTSPSDSPAPMRSDTSFTGRTQPAAVGSSTVSARTSSNPLMRPS